MLTVSDFMFRNNFTDVVTDAIVEQAIQIVYTDWTGIPTLWRCLPPSKRAAKIKLCMNYLTAWWLADAYPAEVIGVFSTGGAQITEKRIQQVAIKYKERNVQDGLSKLQTNFFGLKALDMITSVPETYQLY